jgi:aspartate/methionine/tyrosine aminotransferase
MKKDFSKRVTNLKLSAIKEVAAEVKRAPGIISLAQGLPSFSTPEHIREAAAKALLKDEKGIGAYTLYSGTKSLKKNISEKLVGEISHQATHVRAQMSNFGIDSEREIFVTVGAMEGLAASILSIVGPGDEVILPTPNYRPHITEVKLAGGTPIFVQLTKEASSGTDLAYESASRSVGFFEDARENSSRIKSSNTSRSLGENLGKQLSSKNSKSTKFSTPLKNPLSRLADSGSSKKWSWKLKDIEKAVTGKTKLIILTNPGNPSGCLFDYKLLEGIVKLAKSKNIWVLADETYSFLTYDNLPHVSLGIFRKEYDKIVVVRSFSKEYAMTGWRIGYVWAPEELVTQALKIHDALIGCPSSVSQKGALAALTGTQSVVDGFRKELTARRELICGKLDELSDYFEYVRPQGAYYVWVRIKVKSQKSKVKSATQNLKLNYVSSTEFTLRLLRDAKVAVVPGEAFGPGGEEYIRMCFAVSRDDIIEGFERISRFLKHAN